MSPFASFPDFPLRDSLGGGRFVPDEHYLGRGAEQVLFGRSPRIPGVRYLISHAPDNGLDLPVLEKELLEPIPGIFTGTFVGRFDEEGHDVVRDARRRAEGGFVEELPRGGPSSQVVPLAKAHAIALGAQVGRILLRAANKHGCLLLGLRPEYIWTALEGLIPIVTGIGGRNTIFFWYAGRERDLPTAPLFTRMYVAPEVRRGEVFDSRALVLTLAVMIAEWANGAYPYDSDGAFGYWNLCAGRHQQLQVHDRAAQVLKAALAPSPANRPTLETFVDELDALT